jgi:Zn-dependent M28 family amino/carboxypeptidase
MSDQMFVSPGPDLARPPPLIADPASIFPFQASQLYSTQHETAKTIKAVINLEAAGSTGQEMLFQATSSELVAAYSHVPYPHGTVLAADVFASGIMGSDTDFGFVQVQGLI